MKLSRCPFCGDKMKLSYSSFGHEYRIWHKHENCLLEDPFIIPEANAKSMEEAAEIWNRRANDV